MSKELEQLVRTLQSGRRAFELKQLASGIPVAGEASRSQTVAGANIEDFQTRGPLVQESQYRQQHRQQGRK